MKWQNFITSGTWSIHYVIVCTWAKSSIWKKDSGWLFLNSGIPSGCFSGVFGWFSNFCYKVTQSFFNLQDWIKTSVHLTMIWRWSNCSFFCIFKRYFNQKSFIPRKVLKLSYSTICTSITVMMRHEIRNGNFENLLVENQHFDHL